MAGTMLHGVRGWVLGLTGAALLVGCVPYKKYAAVEEDRNRLERANEDLVRRLNQYVLRLKEADEAGAPKGISPAEYEQILAERDRLRAQLASAEKEIGKFDPRDATQIGPDVHVDDSGALVVRDDLLFSEGLAELKRSQLDVLDRLADLLRSKYAQDTFIIEGHTDNQPLVKTLKLHEDNLNLGYKRARRVYKYLREQGLGEERFTLVTYGFTRPTDPASADSEAGRRRNRRVVIRRVTGGANGLAVR